MPGVIFVCLPEGIAKNFNAYTDEDCPPGNLLNLVLCQDAVKPLAFASNAFLFNY
jgi:hypothetical protein